ncbi:MAG: TraB/GumN family protein [Chitinophagaceae bacterium]|nr:TraB/GumN family protein [Chitinophagaceae bacterium]
MLFMKRTTHVLTFVLTILTNLLYAQVPTDKAIFWEITSPGSTKPSYLYGTMHVSKKVAFRLPDKFYDAIKEVDVVALESNPETWNEALDQSEDIQTLYDLTYIGLGASLNYNKPYYSTIYNIKPVTNSILASELSYEPHSANELLFRSYGLQKNFEEDTYLDLYIYKTGKKFGKPIASLENVLWSMITVVKASFETTSKKNTKPYEGDIMKDMEDAYRDQDLAKLDSIQKASARSEGYLQGLLYTRNDTMFANLNARIKAGQAVFAAVGAAHLGGEKGLLRRFLQAGYHVKPIKDASRLEPSSKILALDTVYMPVTFNQHYSKDSTLRFVAPGYTSRSSPFGKVEYLSTDMVNGVYYYIGRLNTFSDLGGLTTKQLEQKFDSLLFEHVKGTILNKEKITWQGYPCLHVVSRTKDGNLHKQRIMITPLEILYCKVVGKESYFAKYNVDTFLTSIQIKYKKQIEVLKLSDVSVAMPLSLLDHPFPRIAYNAPDFLAQGVDQDGDYFQLLKNYTVRQYEHEEDTFHVAMCAFFLLRDLKLKRLEQTSLRVKGLPAIDLLAENNLKKKVYIRIVLRASNIYYLLARTDNKLKAERFFNSFEPVQQVTLDMVWYKDTARAFMFRTNTKPLAGELSDAIFNQTNEVKDHGAKRKNTYTCVFGDYDLGYQLTVSMQEFNLYECYPTIDSFWNSLFAEFKLQNDQDEKMIITKKTWQQSGQNFMRVEITDTNTQCKSVTQLVTTGNKLLAMTSFYDTTQQSFRYIDTALNSLKFTKAEPSVLTLSKLDTFFTHLQSKDSTTKEYFSQHENYLNIIPSDEKKLIALLDTSDILRRRDDVYNTLLFELNQFKNAATLDFIKKEYQRNEDNAERQVLLLNVLSTRNDTASTLLFKELMMDMPPLEFSEDDDPVNHYFDTLSLAKLLMPEFLDLTDIDDYRYDVIYLTNELLKEKRIDSTLYANKVTYFTLKGKEEIRRKTSQKSSLEQQQLEEEEDKEEDKISNITSGLDGVYAIIDEETRFQSDINFGDFYLIKTFANLLKPYQQREQVREFFRKLDSTGNKDLRFDLALTQAKKKLPFNDKVISEYAALPKYCYSILHLFYFNEIWNKLPIKINSQQEVAKLRVMQHAALNVTDEIKFVNKVWVNNGRDKGYIYIFKHKKKKDANYLYDFTGLYSKQENDYLPKRSLTVSNISLEKKTYEEFEADVLNQIRVLNRTYITPQQIVLGKEEESMNWMEMMNSMREN